MKPATSIWLFILMVLAVPLAAGDAISFYAPPCLVGETAGGVDVMVIRSGDGIGAVAVDVSAGGGSTGAALGTDFQAASPGNLTWADGDRSYRVVHVPVLHNPAFAPWHSLALTLANPIGGAVVDPYEATIHIPIVEHETNPAGYLTVLLPDATQTLSLQDDVGSLYVRVSRGGGSIGAVGATCSLVDLSAVAGIDFTVPAQPTLSWADGETGTKTLEIPLIKRHRARGPLTFSFNIYGVAGGVGLGVAGANVTITDHLAAVAGTAVIPGWVSVSELAGSAVIQVGRTAGSTGAVSLDWTAIGSSAVDGVNFTAGSGTLHWGAGDGADKAITLPVLADGVATDTLYAYVAYANPGGGLILPPDSGTSLAITEADGVNGTLAFADDLPTVGEAAGQVVLTVSRSGGSTGAVSVDWATQDGTASDGSNYTGGSGTLNWGDGDVADKTIAIPLIDDGALGPNRYFRVSLANAGGGAAIIIDPDLGMPEAIVSITDAQCQAGSIAWISAAVQVHENAGSVTLSASRSGGSAGPVSVPLTSLDLTARLGVDYSPGDVATLVWADGDVADKSITIPILHDGLPGTDRAFRVLLGPASGGATVTLPTPVVVTILEDDQVLAAPVASGGGPSSAPAGSGTSSAGGGCSGGAVAMLLGLACALTGLRRRVQPTLPC